MTNSKPVCVNPPEQHRSCFASHWEKLGNADSDEIRKLSRKESMKFVLTLTLVF